MTDFHHTPPDPSLTIPQQYAGQAYNAAGDQYVHYLQTVQQQRDSFLRDVAASRTRAKHLIWFGLLLFILGSGTYAWMIIRFVSNQDLNSEQPPSPEDLFGEEVGGVPVGLIGFATAGIGSVMVVIGIILHIVATSRQRRTLSQPPLPPDWSSSFRSASHDRANR